MNKKQHFQRNDLVRIAIDAMRDRGLEPEFPPHALQQLDTIAGPVLEDGPLVRDFTDLPWCSIDNDDSLDLDQLTACGAMGSGAVKIWIAVADVDVLVKKNSAIDVHARINTTSVYTSARVFPMLPERLSTDLTSLNPGEERVAIVTEMVVDAEGEVTHSAVHRARVRNQAKLAYDAVAAWLTGDGPLPEAASAVPGMDEQLRTQDAVAQRMRVRRRAMGSLDFETFQPRAVFEGERVVGIHQQVQNRARQLIEEFMIATNTCTAQFLAQHGCNALRRVVRSPERWLRIVQVAAKYGTVLPPTPDSRALEGFLARQRKADPLRFPTCRWSSSSSWVRVNTWLSMPGASPLATSGWRCATTPTPRRPTAATLTSSPCAWSRPCWPGRIHPTGWANWPCWPSTARSRKMPRKRWNAVCASPKPRSICKAW